MTNSTSSEVFRFPRANRSDGNARRSGNPKSAEHIGGLQAGAGAGGAGADRDSVQGEQQLIVVHSLECQIRHVRQASGFIPVHLDSVYFHE